MTCVHEIGHAVGAYHEQQNPLSKGIVRNNIDKIQTGELSLSSFR